MCATAAKKNKKQQARLAAQVNQLTTLQLMRAHLSAAVAGSVSPACLESKPTKESSADGSSEPAFWALDENIYFRGCVRLS